MKDPITAKIDQQILRNKQKVAKTNEMLAFGAFRRQKLAFPKLAAFQTHPETVPKLFPQ